MSTKKINVLFKGNEKTFEIDLQENNTYDLFVKKINQEFNRNQVYQLMAMNSKEPYIILNEDNYLSILNEDIEGGLKIFMSEVVKTQDLSNTRLEVINNQKEKEEEKDEKEDDEVFIIEEGQENPNISNNINIEQEKINEENHDSNEIKEEEKNNENEDKIMNNDVGGYKSMIIKSKTTSVSEPKSDNLPNKINFFDEENDLMKNKYILPSFIVTPETFEMEKCDSCKSKLEGIKYLCCVCEKAIFCEECELYHNHPCFKYKSQFLSNILDISNFIERNYNYKLPYESTGYTKLFRKEYDLKIAPLTDFSFCLRPNKKVFLPIKILNYSKENINSSQFLIICKNQKNIFLSTKENEIYNIESGGEYVLNIICLTPERTGPKETITIEIYSHELNIKSSRRLSYEYTIEINFDADDDKINMELKNDDSIFCFNKEHKKIALEVMKSTNNAYKIKNVFRCLFENNWEQNKAIKSLKKMN